MSLYRLLSSIPRPLIHKTCSGCNGCRFSCDHIIPVSFLKNISHHPHITTDPHNIFLICHSFNKRKSNNLLFTHETTSSLESYITDSGKGIIARSILYMEFKYDIKLDNRSIMYSFHEQFPPQELEIARHDILTKIYGPNPYISSDNVLKFQ